MLSDVISPASYLTFNVTIAHIIGLVNSVYCSELLDIVNKARKKHKIDENGFFVVNRDYVKNRTSIKINEQYLCDASLNKVGLIESDKENPDKIKFDITRYMQIIAEDDSKTLNNIYKKVTLKSNKEESKQLQRDKVRFNLKSAINSGNVKIDSALQEWVDIVFESKDMIVDTVKEFQTTLMKYASNDIDLALRIITIAKTQLWTNCTYAIDSYEKEQKLLSKKVKTSNFKVATSLSSKKY